jgi:DNA repair exonuclease SbcCD ATPase subunit
MFNFNDTTHADKLDKAIADLLEELDALTGSQEDYTTTATNLAKLMELKNQAIKTGNEATKIENDNVKAQTDNLNEREKIQTEQSKIELEREKIELDRDKYRLDTDKFAADQEALRSWKPSPDAIVGAAASVIGILFVLHYEKLGVVTSKALGFIGKMK